MYCLSVEDIQISFFIFHFFLDFQWMFPFVYFLYGNAYSATFRSKSLSFHFCSVKIYLDNVNFLQRYDILSEVILKFIWCQFLKSSFFFFWLFVEIILLYKVISLLKNSIQTIVEKIYLSISFFLYNVMTIRCC